MVHVLAIPMSDSVVAGVTMVDTSILPWPGATFSTGTSATDAHVEQSFTQLAETLQVPRHAIVSVRQVHGDRVVVLNGAMVKGAEEADALVTDVPGQVIGVKIADCLGVLIYDPDHHVIAAVHSGWRGTVQDVTTRTIERLQQGWGSRPDQLIVACSPHANGTHYEVQADVQNLLPQYCTPVSGVADRWLLDNQAAVVEQLVRAGVRRDRIQTSDRCTMVDPQFHSHRRDGERAGRCFAFIGLRIAAGQQLANP